MRSVASCDFVIRRAVFARGNRKVGFEVNGKLKRKDFNLKWNVVTEAGGVVASDEVRIHCNVQFIRGK